MDRAYGQSNRGWRWPGASPRPGPPSRGSSSGQRGSHPRAYQRGFFRSRDQQAGAGGRVAREGSVMTRARALKQVIRARAAKTGERYTTARRHILRELNSPTRHPLHPRHPQLHPHRKKAACPTRSRSRRPATISRTGLRSSIASAGSRRDTPPHRAFSTSSTTSPAGTVRASSSPTNARAASA